MRELPEDAVADDHAVAKHKNGECLSQAGSLDAIRTSFYSLSVPKHITFILLHEFRKTIGAGFKGAPPPAGRATMSSMIEASKVAPIGAP